MAEEMGRRDESLADEVEAYLDGQCGLSRVVDFQPGESDSRDKF